MYQSLIAILLTVGLTANAVSLRRTITPEGGSDTTESVDCVISLTDTFNRDPGADVNDKVARAEVTKLVRNGSESETRKLSVKIGYSEEQIEDLLSDARSAAATSLVSYTTPPSADKLDIRYSGTYERGAVHTVTLYASGAVIGERSNRSAAAMKLRDIINGLCTE